MVILGVIGSIPPPPNTASWVDAKELDFGLIWPLHFHPVFLWIIGKLDRPVHVLSWTGDLAGVVLGWFLTVLMITETPRGEILHGAPVRGRLTVILCFFHLWIITPTVINFSPSCWRWSSSPFQPCVGPWHPWTDLWSWPWWRVWNRIDWLLLWTGVLYTGVIISAPYLYKRLLGARNLADWWGIKY